MCREVAWGLRLDVRKNTGEQSEDCSFFVYEGGKFK